MDRALRQVLFNFWSNDTVGVGPKVYGGDWKNLCFPIPRTVFELFGVMGVGRNTWWLVGLGWGWQWGLLSRRELIGGRKLLSQDSGSGGGGSPGIGWNWMQGDGRWREGTEKQAALDKLALSSLNFVFYYAKFQTGTLPSFNND